MNLQLVVRIKKESIDALIVKEIFVMCIFTDSMAFIT